MEQLIKLEDLKPAARSGLDYFLSYVAIESTADEESGEWPSSPGQLELARQIVADLAEIGIEAELDKNGYVMATIPGNTDAKTLGLIAHMDTSPDFTARDVKPRRLHYTGGDIVLNETEGIVLDEATFPNLRKHVGHDLIVTDGTTLLGADDKAGVAAIVELAALLQANPKVPHGPIALGFTPDEEIGNGAARFDVERFGAAYAYTLDGGAEGELEYENFNAAVATVRFKGRNVHPGSAKDKLVNAALLAADYAWRLPEAERPEHTAGREGFYHLTKMSGNTEEARLEFIIRDHDMDRFKVRKAHMQAIAGEMNDTLGQERVTIELRDQYYNMIKQIKPYPELVERAREAMRAVGVEPAEAPIRGGTDGAQLSFKGLPCPNLFTGGENFHGPYEFLDVDTFERSVAMLVALVQLFA